MTIGIFSMEIKEIGFVMSKADHDFGFVLFAI
jgi:hypothetical protein